MRRLGALVVFSFFAPLAFASCSHSAEGESCEVENGNDDCDEGLICRGPWEINSKEPVCCPRPPAKPSSSACEPKLDHHTPDPSVDASPIPPGDGSSGGSGGTSGAGGTAGGGGTAGAAGSAGAAGDAGPNDAASDAPSDAKADSPSDAKPG
jgi:hypothetical protein